MGKENLRVTGVIILEYSFLGSTQLSFDPTPPIKSVFST
jgi:hypothetical protein